MINFLDQLLNIIVILLCHGLPLEITLQTEADLVRTVIILGSSQLRAFGAEIAVAKD